MRKYEGFLYGHYDSRGGCSFIEADSKEKADAVYLQSFCLGEEELKAIMAPYMKTYGEEIIEEDFLGAATIESEDEIEDGTDMEYGEHGDRPIPLWVQFSPNNPENTNQGNTGSYRLRYGGECPAGFQESELGEDAFGVIIMRAPYNSTGRGE